MKILISVILIFAIVFIGGFFHFILIKNYMSTLSEHANKLLYLIANENEEYLKKETENLEQDWLKMRKTLCFLIDHDCIFEIDGAILEIKELPQSDFIQYSASLSRLKNEITCITESASFTVENIL